MPGTILTPDPTDLLSALAALSRSERAALAVAACERRDADVRDGRPQWARVYNCLAALAREIDDHERATLGRLEDDLFGGTVTCEPDDDTPPTEDE